MGMLEQHPPHIRKKIAMIATGVLAVILLGILIVVYTGPKNKSGKDTPASKLGDFYETILKNGQAYFSR